ncbi:MAG: indole-3-glycerol phosphate synthase TrpC [Rhodospirillales bacterium]|nr:indole-3-glycerol phosphate synthase TrpC [Alphaproteobacteria bacterium]MCB1840480.1 indole-3-glycerol phosphate synthase TrpC [Alphaproteobacteria bacterium]MCB9977422.1 indole-3-glycerol phosphate synthase TrpC [Rhodospirillales bacterium]
MNTLEEICERKREHVRNRKSYYSLDDLKYKIADKPLPSGFLCKMMMAEGPALIAEVKKASPSRGIIREDFDPVDIAKSYQEAGASCLSVLTDEPYFQGRDEYLELVKEALTIPVLRKDFIIDVYQVYESRALGADCILLIMAALDDALARRLYETALELRMDILVEVHDLPELERALKLDPMMIGVNNRDLKTLEVNTDTSFDLVMRLPSSVYKISESGIGSHDMLTRLHKVGYRGFLVGESLMKEPDIGKATRTLLGR